jgi:hypothetical protein
MPLMAPGSEHTVVCFGDLDQDQSVFLPYHKRGLWRSCAKRW